MLPLFKIKRSVWRFSFRAAMFKCQVLHAFNGYVKSLNFVSAMFLKVCAIHRVKLSTAVCQNQYLKLSVCVFVCVIENMCHNSSSFQNSFAYLCD
uniref:Uncharacterized protein n=1 Tax=Rhipicephalus zambeziensis TaxID=60191 RepID=A0A224YHD3_9ACAR